MLASASSGLIKMSSLTANISFLTNFTQEEYLQFLEQQLDLKCDGIYASQLWICNKNENISNYILGAIATAVFILGLISNMGIILKIILERSEWTILRLTFLCTMIANLIALLVAYVIGYVIEVITRFDAEFGFQFFFSVVTSLSAAFHVFQLCYMRHRHLTIMNYAHDKKLRLTVIMSVSFWILSVIIGLSFTTPVTINFSNEDFTSQSGYSQILRAFAEQHLYFRFVLTCGTISLLITYTFCIQRRETYDFCEDKKARRKYQVISVFAFLYILACLEEIILGTIYIIQEKTTLAVIATSEFRFFHNNQITWVIAYSAFSIMYAIVCIPFTDAADFCSWKFRK